VKFVIDRESAAFFLVTTRPEAKALTVTVAIHIVFLSLQEITL